MTPGTTDDEARWAEAQSVLDQAPTESAVARQRKNRRTIWSIVAGAGLISGAIGGVAGGLAASPGTLTDTSEPATWQYVVGFTLSGLGLIGAAISLVSLIRAGQWGAAWRSPMSSLTRQQRKHLLGEVRGKEPLDPAHLDLARDLAVRLEKQRRHSLLMGSLLLLWVGQVIVSPDLLHLVLLGVLALTTSVAVLLLLRDARLARRFLAEHPAA